ncbi:putative MO25-like protein [Hordeum vulgare]|nr:putative MO25-like protein [Hordeum vulgare]
MPPSAIDLKITQGYSGVGHCEDDAQRKHDRSFVPAHMAGARKLFDNMPPPTQTTTGEDPDYASFMQNVIFEGRGEAFHVHDQEQDCDSDETQSQDNRGTYDDTQFAGHDDGDEDDHGKSWHEDDDLYCKDEEEEVDISVEPLLFVDELTQKTKAQNRRKSIRTGSYTQAEDTLICEFEGNWPRTNQRRRAKRVHLLDKSSQELS